MMYISTKIKTNFLILLPLFLIIFNGCSKESKYSQSSSSFKFMNSTEECETFIELDKNHEFIEKIYSSCQQKVDIRERIKDIKKTIKHFNIQNKFKESSIIKITFLKNGIAFPNLLKYINKDKKWNNNIFSYDKESSFQNISNKYYQEMSLYISDSNIYLDITNDSILEECNLKLYPQFYLKDKTLYTIPKVYHKQLLLNNNLFNTKDSYNKKFPAIDYLPFRITCNP